MIDWSLDYFAAFDIHAFSLDRDLELLERQYALHERAMRLLAERNANEIAQIIDVVDGLLAQHNAGALDRLAREIEAGESKNAASLLQGAPTVDELLHAMASDHAALVDGYDLASAAIPDLHWHEVFAVMALNALGLNVLHGMFLMRDRPASDESSDRTFWAARHQVREIDNAAFFVFKAWDVLSLAEAMLVRKDAADRHTGRKVSLNAKSAAEARHAGGNAIKKGFIKYELANGPWDSLAAAARAYWHRLPPGDKKTLCPSMIEANAVRTLTDYRRHVKKRVLREN